jgi:hypothetical protein
MGPSAEQKSTKLFQMRLHALGHYAISKQTGTGFPVVTFSK